MAIEGGQQYRVDRGNGDILIFNQADADRYVAANPSARNLGPYVRKEAQDSGIEGLSVEGENATEPQTSEIASPNYEEMTLPELRDYADAHQVDLTDATRKQDVIERIQAAEGAPAAAE